MCAGGLTCALALAAGAACGPTAAPSSVETVIWPEMTPPPTAVPLAARTPEPVFTAGPMSGGATAPDFTVATLDHGLLRLSEQRGRAVGVLVMASWCGPCVPETQAWDRLFGEYGAKGLLALALSGDPGDTPEDLRRFASIANASRLALAQDVDGAFLRLFQVRSLDTTLLFDRAGRLVFRDAVPTPYDVLRREVDKALA